MSVPSLLMSPGTSSIVTDLLARKEDGDHTEIFIFHNRDKCSIFTKNQNQIVAQY